MRDASLIQRAVQRIAEDRIREGEERGLFDNLPGQGKPLPEIEMGTPEMHLVNWVQSWAKRERVNEYEQRKTLAALQRKRAQ